MTRKEESDEVEASRWSESRYPNESRSYIFKMPGKSVGEL
jgi:hypothetical protein